MSTLVSIGLPVYNEEKYIAYTLDSLTSQTFKDIEIIVCDNASTDKTPDIIQEFIKDNKNIKYHRATENKGIMYNFLKALELSTGKYFMWGGGHDAWSKNFIEKVVHQLELHPDAAIAYAKVIWIDENNSEASRQSGWYDTRGMHPIERFLTTIWGNIHPVLGLMRTNYIKDVSFVNTPGGDLLILAEMVLKGDFLHVEGATIYRRELHTRAKESISNRIKRYQGNDFKISLGIFNKIFPLLRLPFELVRIIIKSRLTFLEKFYLLFAALPAFLIKYLVALKK